jgi:hypothetical protein
MKGLDVAAAAVVLAGCSLLAIGQQAPSGSASSELPQPPASVVGEPDSVPPGPSVAEQAPMSSEPASPAAPVIPGILILPPEFIVYQQSVGATEPVPEWTTAAQANIESAARAVLTQDSRFAVVDLPSIEDADRAALREHVELFKVVAMNLEGVVKPGGKPWQPIRDNADFRLGEGLRFLKSRTGADYALVLSGAEIRQTGGSIFMQLAIAGVLGAYVPGGGTFMYCGIVDLESGRVTWYNSSLGASVFGMGGSANTDKEAGATKSIGTLFKSYPESPGLKFVAVNAPSAPAPAPVAEEEAVAEPVIEAPEPATAP